MDCVGNRLAVPCDGQSAVDHRLFFLFDLAELRINFSDEIKKGNIAAAIVVAGFILGIRFIVGRAVGS